MVTWFQTDIVAGIWDTAVTNARRSVCVNKYVLPTLTQEASCVTKTLKKKHECRHRWSGLKQKKNDFYEKLVTTVTFNKLYQTRIKSSHALTVSLWPSVPSSPWFCYVYPRSHPHCFPSLPQLARLVLVFLPSQYDSLGQFSHHTQHSDSVGSLIRLLLLVQLGSLTYPGHPHCFFPPIPLTNTILSYTFVYVLTVVPVGFALVGSPFITTVH